MPPILGIRPLACLPVVAVYTACLHQSSPIFESAQQIVTNKAAWTSYATTLS
ncbi:hypothetical protein VULLAG_LOCUS17918 [Vulpes lagopus]